MNARRAFLVKQDGTIFDPVADPSPTKIVTVTPGDEVDEEEEPTGNAVTLAGGPYRALSVAAIGTIHVQFLDGSDATIPAGSLSAGLQHSLWFTGVYETGTTAMGILAYK